MTMVLGPLLHPSLSQGAHIAQAAVRCMASLHSLLGAQSSWEHRAADMPTARGSAEHNGHGQDSQQPGSSGMESLPSLCGEPKNKLSLHRRGNRRISYYAKRKELFAQCKHCGQTGLPHQFFAGGQQCTGECLRSWPQKEYKPEYKPPC